MHMFYRTINIFILSILGRDRDVVTMSFPANVNPLAGFRELSITVLDSRVVWIISIDV